VETNNPIRKIVGTPTNKRLAAKPKLVVSITEVFTQNKFAEINYITPQQKNLNLNQRGRDFVICRKNPR
tara:strand:- start:290 stop:496 length:207 start_codon:yes stop_codon:yes gene_type:complete